MGRCGPGAAAAAHRMLAGPGWGRSRRVPRGDPPAGRRCALPAAVARAFTSARFVRTRQAGSARREQKPQPLHGIRARMVRQARPAPPTGRHGRSLPPRRLQGRLCAEERAHRGQRPWRLRCVWLTAPSRGACRLGREAHRAHPRAAAMPIVALFRKYPGDGIRPGTGARAGRLRHRWAGRQSGGSAAKPQARPSPGWAGPMRCACALRWRRLRTESRPIRAAPLAGF